MQSTARTFATALCLATLAGGSLALAEEPTTGAAQPSVAAPATPSKAESLPTDPSLVTGKLENGLSYIVRKHGNPEGRVSVWLHVSSGSLNETESIRGIAHYLEHMAFNGSANFPPGSVVDFFQSLGLQFGRDQNAFTSFDQTTYQLALPNTNPATIDKALMFMSDVGMRLSLLDKEIDSERQIILEEKRTRASAQQRIQEYLFERLAPGSTFGRRLPIGTEATVKSVQKPDFLGYYGKWYVPSNMTVIVVGDMDPAPVVDQIKKAFADGKTVPRPTDLDVGVKPYTESRAIIATDPELTNASISITRIEPSKGPTLTVAQMRDDLVELIGTWAFNRRISAEQAKGGVSYLSASASARDQANTLQVFSIDASGKTENWRKMFTEMGVDLQRARLHGFTDRELSDARTSLIAQAEESATRENTLPARAILGRINGAVAAGEPIMSSAQRLELLKKLLPTITAKEVSEVFARNFDPSKVAFVVELPSSGDVPSEADLIKLGTEAVSVKPEKAAEDARAEKLLNTLPSPGKTVEQENHAATSVWQGWSDNNTRLHHRFMDVRKDEVTITITLAGGEIAEKPETRGLTSAASLAFAAPATSTLTSTNIRDLMTGKKVRVGGGPGGDTVSLSVSGSPADLETGMQLAYLLLTDPVIEPARFQQWKQSQTQNIARRATVVEGVLAEAMADTVLPKGEVRTRPLTQEQLDKVSIEAAQAWLKRIISTSPIEVSVVGDISREQAEALVLRYIGSLPKRERISDRVYGDLRTIKHNPGPLTASRELATKTDKAIVMDGFFGADMQNVTDVRLLQVASRVLSTRMVKIIREEKQLVYSIGAQSRPGSEYPGMGVFVAQAPTDPAKADALPVALEELYTDFAKTGPTEEEMTVARKQLVNLIEETMKEPDFWIGRLATITYRGLKLDDLTTAADFYKNVQAKDVQSCFAKYYKPESRFKFIVKPAPAAANATKSPDSK